MTTAPSLPADTLAVLANADTQRLVARMAQDVFAGLFRQTFSADEAAAAKVMAETEQRCANWCQAGEGEEGQALRLALLISGLDQWGLAYAQAFNLTAIPPLTSLLGVLRTGLAARAEARFQWYFSQIDKVETDAIDFKIELRRAIHVALWHAMAACESASQAEAILQALGGQMLALDKQMPALGWRLIADALASIQIALLGDPVSVSDVGREVTQQLFESLRHALPGERFQSILALSGQAVVAWQQAQRAAAAS